jgi:hypothetical protein
VDRDVSAGQRFGDVLGRNEAEIAFLVRLRHEAGSWAVAGLSSDDTSSAYIGVPLYADVHVPGVPTLRRWPQIAFWTDGPWAQRSGGLILQGGWGDDRPLDDHDGNDPECLTVVGVDVSLERHAAWAAEWIVRQLLRPVAREDRVRNGQAVASTWRLADTGTVLQRQGVSRRRLLRRAPDLVTEIR